MPVSKVILDPVRLTTVTIKHLSLHTPKSLSASTLKALLSTGWRAVWAGAIRGPLPSVDCMPFYRRHSEVQGADTPAHMANPRGLHPVL